MTHPDATKAVEAIALTEAARLLEQSAEPFDRACAIIRRLAGIPAQPFNATAAKTVTCCFCGSPCDSLVSLKEHSATCAEHPAVKEIERLVEQICHTYQITGHVSEGDEIDSARKLRDRCNQLEADLVAARETIGRQQVRIRSFMVTHGPSWIPITERKPTEAESFRGDVLWGYPGSAWRIGRWDKGGSAEFWMAPPLMPGDVPLPPEPQETVQPDENTVEPEELVFACPKCRSTNLKIGDGCYVCDDCKRSFDPSRAVEVEPTPQSTPIDLATERLVPGETRARCFNGATATLSESELRIDDAGDGHFLWFQDGNRYCFWTNSRGVCVGDPGYSIVTILPAEVKP